MAWKKGDRTICELLRQLMDRHAKDDVTMLMLGECIFMAKRMDLKLKQNNPNYYDEFWQGQDYHAKCAQIKVS